VFAVQSEVAQVIASTLNAEITPEVKQRIESIPTKSIEAYDLYLRGIGSIDLNYTVSQKGSLALLKKAIEKDSSFAEAYAMLGFRTIFQAGFIGDKNPSSLAKEAKVYLDKALLLDPQSSLAHVTMANYLTWYEKDFKQAESHYRLAIELAPSNVVSYVSIIDLLLSLGRFDEALKYSEKILELDATNYDYWGRKTLVCAFRGDEDEMSESMSKAMEAGSEFIIPFTASARAYLIRKKYDKALEILSQRDNLQSFPRTMGIKSIAFFKLGELENHLKELNALIQRAAETAGGSPSFYTAMVYASKGEKEEAFRWLDNSYRNNEVELYWLKVEPEFASLHSDPRWQAMLNKVGFPETAN
jgi:tetratricopeptide (TPR) repeat protein